MNVTLHRADWKGKDSQPEAVGTDCFIGGLREMLYHIVVEAEMSKASHSSEESTIKACK